jgi:cytoskeletal protein CcmA (bactofilin family)
VASGGAMNIEKSENFNVDTDIYVSGELDIEPGAKVKGNIIVQKGGEVRMQPTNAAIDGVRYDGDIYIEGGGSLTIGTRAAITVGGIYVSGGDENTTGGALTIAENTTITGDIFCAGDLTIEGDFTLNYEPISMGGIKPGDNPGTVGIDESTISGGAFVYHGIFLYNSPVFGTGTLHIDDNDPPKISSNSNSGRIHAFAGYIGVPYAQGNLLFSGERDEDNATLYWTTKISMWQKQGDLHELQQGDTDSG